MKQVSKLKKPNNSASKPDPQDTAQKIADGYPAALAVFLAGSVVRQEHTHTSDLDIVVVTEHDPEAPYRKSLLVDNWPVELFVHTRDSLRRFFKSDCEDRTPSLPQMCREGLIVTQLHGAGDNIKAEADALVRKGPPALSESEVLVHRYHITDLLDDLKGSTRLEENLFIVPELIKACLELYCALHQLWSGQGKWMWRILDRNDPRLAKQLSKALHAAYQDHNNQPLLEWVHIILEPVGGPYFEGHYQKAPR